MAARLRRHLFEYLRENFLLYLIVFAFFTIGTALGAMLVKPFTIGQQVELLAYIDSFINSLLNREISSAGMFKQALFNNVKLVFFIWFLGLTVIGVPVIVGLLFARGFILGFTVAFLVQEKGVQGITISLLSVLPPNMILLPALIIGGVSAISFSLLLIRGSLKSSFIKLMQQFISYSMLMIVVAILAVIAALIEAYVAPEILKLIAVYG